MIGAILLALPGLVLLAWSLATEHRSANHRHAAC